MRGERGGEEQKAQSSGSTLTTQRLHVLVQI